MPGLLRFMPPVVGSLFMDHSIRTKGENRNVGEQMTNNEQWNTQLKKLSGDGSCEGVISSHCGINPKDVELLENLYKAAQETRKRRIESKEYKKKMINLITNKED
jgi:hypothetical protein